MKAKDGHRFILMVTPPSGEKFAIGGVDGMLALIPIQKEEGALRGLLGWDSMDSLNMWLEDFKKKNGELNWEKWMQLNPEIGQVKLAQ